MHSLISSTPKKMLCKWFGFEMLFCANNKTNLKKREVTPTYACRTSNLLGLSLVVVICWLLFWWVTFFVSSCCRCRRRRDQTKQEKFIWKSWSIAWCSPKFEWFWRILLDPILSRTLRMALRFGIWLFVVVVVDVVVLVVGEDCGLTNTFLAFLCVVLNLLQSVISAIYGPTLLDELDEFSFSSNDKTITIEGFLPRPNSGLCFCCLGVVIFCDLIGCVFFFLGGLPFKQICIPLAELRTIECSRLLTNDPSLRTSFWSWFPKRSELILSVSYLKRKVDFSSCRSCVMLVLCCFAVCLCQG